MNKPYDILIIGAGPAGMTAAIYAGRAGKSIAIIDKDGFGGNIAKSPKVENIPGFDSISGIDFSTKLYEQMLLLKNVEHSISEAARIEYSHGLFITTMLDRTAVISKSIIFATGTTHRSLKLETKDIYFCVTCDGPFFKNKDVIVVGSGNTGATYALELSTYCNNVYICDITNEMCCENILTKQINETNNIHWLNNCTITNVINNKNGKLNSVVLSTDKTIKCSAIFAATGQEPQTAIANKFAELDENNYIKSTDCSTSLVPGVFVAGDCRTNSIKQVVTAESDGATAALLAVKYINSLK